jgi:hypothetical protein
MNSIISLAAGAALLVGAGAANANEPIKLTDAQMDTVKGGIIVVDDGRITIIDILIVTPDFIIEIL